MNTHQATYETALERLERRMAARNAAGVRGKASAGALAWGGDRA